MLFRSVLIPSKQPQHRVGLKANVRIDKEQMVAVGFQELVGNQVPRPRHDRTTADATDLDGDAVLKNVLSKTRKRDCHLDAHLVIVGGQANHDFLASEVETFLLLHKSPVENRYTGLVGNGEVNAVIGKHTFPGDQERGNP